MAKQIIILDTPDFNRFTVLFWLSVPAKSQEFLANTGISSSYKKISAEELADLQNGLVVEQIGDYSYEVKTPMDQIKAELVKEFAIRQEKLNVDTKRQNYGTFYDGATWTDAGAK